MPPLDVLPIAAARQSVWSRASMNSLCDWSRQIVPFCTPTESEAVPVGGALPRSGNSDIGRGIGGGLAQPVPDLRLGIWVVRYIRRATGERLLLVVSDRLPACSHSSRPQAAPKLLLHSQNANLWRPPAVLKESRNGGHNGFRQVPSWRAWPPVHKRTNRGPGLLVGRKQSVSNCQ